MTASLSLVPRLHKPVSERPADDLWLMILAWNSGSATQRAVALEMADRNRKEAADARSR